MAAERLRTTVEPERRRSPTQAKGWRDEAYVKDWKSVVQAERRLIKVEPKG